MIRVLSVLLFPVWAAAVAYTYAAASTNANANTTVFHFRTVVTMQAPMVFENSAACLQFTNLPEVKQSIMGLKAQLKDQLPPEAKYSVEGQCVQE